MSKILVFIEQAATREHAAESLLHGGFQVTAASDGAAFLKSLAAQKFDLAIIDLHAYSINSVELLNTLKRRASPIPSILLANSESEKVALACHADHVLFRPVSVADWVVAANKVLGG